VQLESKSSGDWENRENATDTGQTQVARIGGEKKELAGGEAWQRQRQRQQS